MKTVFLSGTGTDVGKTHFAEAILRADATDDRARRVVVWKPYESGIQPGVASDSDRLAEAVRVRRTHMAHETVRLEPPLERFAQPLAPPLAAKLAGHGLKTDAFAAALERLRRRVRRAPRRARRRALRAADRDVARGRRRALGAGLQRWCSWQPTSSGSSTTWSPPSARPRASPSSTSCLSAVEHPDPSSAHNADVLRELVTPQLHLIPREPVEVLSQSRAVRTLSALLL